MKLLVCTDLDRTLLPNGPQPESPGARQAFAALAEDPRVRIVYVTGRSIRLTEEAIEKYQVPFPDILIADVGTTICHREQGQWRRDREWDELISKNWPLADSSGPTDLLRNLPGLQIQEKDRLTRFKLSYYAEAEANKDSLSCSITSIFAQHNIRASLIWSHDEVADQELLDILPAGADKYQALQFLRQQMEYRLNEMIFSGDSGNDLEVLSSEIPAVLVANARQEVAEKAEAMATAAGNGAKLYLACGGWQDMNGCYSAGILEGIAYYFPQFCKKIARGRIMGLLSPEVLPEITGIWIFGEVLFDTFPDGTAVLGGAPFNVAWNLTAFQAAPRIISAVGNDAPGQVIQKRMHGWQMNCEHLAVVPEYPTGKVTIHLNDGEPSYTIEENQAYDNIPLSSLPEHTDGFLYFGSLALRTAHNLDLLAELKKRHQGKIFIDINLRPPFWDKDSILSLVQDAHWLKLNEAELTLIAKAKGADMESQARQLKADYDLDGIVVTCGSRGAFALGPDDNAIQVKPTQAQEVQDTVGAGDAFTSVLLLGLIRSWPLQKNLQRAQQFASGVVGIQGAVSPDSKFYQQHLQSW
ncbi:hypothetical protein KKHLCK_04965 [Candidatus Electrothrix laxa]